ncbi:hypothetical protein AVEN_31498-1 [Araneus ventricosus]|uniref:Uncharacterized protein n=1 Tax=Araneus ventricosus TaxID=182803 RepID=A0A4Y2T9D2_ARAVE|nr:hypothetical protein AVEN_31498-1 [Araneus ventricosus]
MPLSYNHFLEEIIRYKRVHGLVRNDDEYRKNLWLPFLPADYEGLRLKGLRQDWTPKKSEIGRTKRSLGAGVPLPKALAHLEEPTRCVQRGRICGVADPVPRYINRGPTCASEFQGARTSADAYMGPFFPRYIPERVVHYLQRRIPARHTDCVQLKKNSATLWRDLITSDLDNKSLSCVPRYFHPLTDSANERLHARWPEWRRNLQPELYFKEYLEVNSQPFSVFALNWIDEQLALPYADHAKEQNLKSMDSVRKDTRNPIMHSED